MKTTKSSGAFRPFKNLKSLLESKSATLSPASAEGGGDTYSAPPPENGGVLKPDAKTLNQSAPENDQKLFLEAMAGVTPMSRGNRIEHNTTAGPPIPPDKDNEAEALLRLNNLVESGKGFVVADTPEYIEGTGYNVHPKITKRLHRGEFSIQAHIDLHGLGVADARVEFERFMKDSIRTGKRGVLVVHGRGLSSPDKPVLKTKVIEWLTCGPWRKWVIAFSSARSFDGGAGATYVLLRKRPVTSSQRKRKKLLKD